MYCSTNTFGICWAQVLAVAPCHAGRVWFCFIKRVKRTGTAIACCVLGMQLLWVLL